MPRNDVEACCHVNLKHIAAAGGLFELVSCPHYLAEILIYGGLVLVQGPQSVNIWLIFMWVVRAFPHDIFYTVHT